jgi:putative FmdB family regulatory protein
MPGFAGGISRRRQMPTYEYRCKDCSHELEAQQSFSDDPLTTCPSCGGPLRKKFSSPGISFKGSGFYKTDSRSGTKSSSSSSASGDSGSTSSSSDSPAAEKASTPATPAADGAGKATAAAATP